MRRLINIALLVLTVAMGVLMDEAGLQTSFDRTLKEFRYGMASQDPSNDTVLVEIDSASLQHYRVWPWPRTYHARVLNTLMDLGAEEVVFDIDFSSYSNEADDAEFAQALELAGGYAFLAAFDQMSAITGDIHRSEPIPPFLEHAYPVLVNVLLDQDGFAHSFPNYGTLNDATIVSLPLALARPFSEPPERMLFDFSIDISKIDRIQYYQLMEGLVDPERIAGKQIVIGSSAVELQDFFETPRFGVIPGPLLQILGLETVKSNRLLVDWKYWPSMLMVLAVALLGALVRRRLGLLGLAIGAAITAAIWELVALALFAKFGILMNTALVFVCLPTVLTIQIASEATRWLNQRRRLQNRLQQLARFDDATGAHTRAGFLEHLSSQIQTDMDAAIMLVAIKRLNMVRSALGQEVASQTLKKLSQRLAKVSHSSVGLASQDVFALGIDTQMSDDDLQELGSKIHRILGEPVKLGDHSVLVDAQIAIANKSADTETLADILSHAEIALSNAGKTQTKTIAKYQSELSGEITARQSLDLELRQIIERKQVRLAFQPQVDLKTDRLIGVEALIRWHHPDKGVISPHKFIPLAEETGFIVELGAWVIDEACRITSAWKWEGTLSLNVSPVQLALSDVPATISQALKKYGYPAKQLEIEVTESVLVGDTDKVMADLQAIQKLGCSLAIDDFGTGYSSLSYLSRLPFDKLKIDQTFVRFIDQNKNNKKIVESIVHLAKQLEKKIVAEGIETETEAYILKQLKCDIGQGYLYGRPVDALTLSKLVTGSRPSAQSGSTPNISKIANA